jgi:hypothetical protein
LLNTCFYWLVPSPLCMVKSFTYQCFRLGISSPHRQRYFTSVEWAPAQRSGFDSRLFQIFWGVVGRERGPLSLVNTIEKLVERKSSGSGQENRDYVRKDPSVHVASSPQKLTLTSPTSGCIIENRTYNLPACSIVPQPITLPRDGIYIYMCVYVCVRVHACVCPQWWNLGLRNWQSSSPY